MLSACALHATLPPRLVPDFGMIGTSRCRFPGYSVPVSVSLRQHLASTLRDRLSPGPSWDSSSQPSLPRGGEDVPSCWKVLLRPRNEPNMLPSLPSPSSKSTPLKPAISRGFPSVS